MHMNKTAEHIGFARLFAWALPYAFRRWQELVILLVVMVIGIAISVLQPWPMKVIVDHILHGKPLAPEISRLLEMLPFTETRQGVLSWAVGGTVLLFLLTWLLNVISTYVSAGFGRRMVYDLAADVFYHLQRLSLSFHRRSQLGDTIRRVTGDCSCISALILGALLPVLTSVFTLVTMFSIMWQLNKQLTLLSLAIVPLMLVVLRRYAVPLVECSYRQQEAEGQVFNAIEQTLSSIPAVQAYSREGANDRRFKAVTDENLKALLATTDVQVRFKIFINLSTALGTAGILWIGGRAVLAGDLTVGGILVFLSYLAALYAPLNSLMYTSSTVQGAAGSARRVIEILETEQDVADRPGALALTDVKGHVRIENAVFGYAPGKPLLKNVSIEALPGETVALVGATGAGKTTLV
ncbi:MAG: ABC transporter ATP-binding protein, partial [Verrucomicrobiaceae bacterium]